MGLEWNTSSVVVNDVQYTNPSFCGHQQKTVLLWFSVQDLSAETLCTLFTDPTPGTNEYWFITKSLAAPSGRLDFFQNFSTQGGRWNTPAIVTGTVYHLAVTFDAGNVANNPLIYLNGVSQTVTENLTPIGTWFSGTGSSMYLGTALTNSKHIRIYSMCYYNYIFTADEIMSAYNSRKLIPTREGLVFSPNLLTNGASRDIVTGATGTFNGNPSFVPNSFLSYGGL